MSDQKGNGKNGAVMTSQNQGDSGKPQANPYGEDLPEDQIRDVESRQTRPLEPADIKAVKKEVEQASGPDALLKNLAQDGGDRSATNGAPKEQFRLKPGTTRRKIAGSGVTPDPLVFQTDASEDLLEQWIDATLGTATHHAREGSHQNDPNAPADDDPSRASTPYAPELDIRAEYPSAPVVRRLPLAQIAVAAGLVLIAVFGFFYYRSQGNGVSGGASAQMNAAGAGQPGGGTPAAPLAGDVTVLTTATKVKWLDAEITTFNAANAGKYHIARLPLLESRDGMQAVLSGAAKPTIFTPSSPVWIARLNTVWLQRTRTQTIADMDDPEAFHLLFKSPIVVLTTRDKAPFFTKIFHSAHPWTQVRELSLGHQKTPWGSFKFSHADPLDATSGMLTMTLILTEYAKESGHGNDLTAAAKSPGFHDYLEGLDKSFVRDPTLFGSSALERAYTADPKSRDFITVYESKALEAVSKNPDLVAIYPNPTAVADQSAIVLNADWVTSHEREGGIAFLNYCTTDKAAQDAIQYHFRPAQDNARVTLTAQLQAHVSNGFQQQYEKTALPPYDALNEAANQWRGLMHPGSK